MYLFYSSMGKNYFLIPLYQMYLSSECPLFRGAIASGFGHMCVARYDCLGLSCNIAMLQGYKTEYLRVEMHFNIDESKQRLIFNGSEVDLIDDGTYMYLCHSLPGRN